MINIEDIKNMKRSINMKNSINMIELNRQNNVKQLLLLKLFKKYMKYKTSLKH